ncbi:uncharacterized protein LOC126278457 isoform X2 [Schistocerca gregaria]|uniref:uncharacterized protein LOC126278457 isoform X2 n=1 Tax=Schistocerca gregaria TaxID=7010 RepID=UPI00211DE55C|nr:uncharacterized protein LOC126278457 isoform X2 [Schistocerca gregaria]
MASYHQFLGLALLALAGVWSPGQCLHDVRISVPRHVLRGRSARLTCHYQLGEERLYAVKWYKGRHEFYRYTPSEQPNKKAFPPLGNHVDLKQSTATHVTLINADDSLTGQYICEVSADAPSFNTFVVTDSMDVVDAPRQRPHLTGLRTRYRPGDLLNVNCTAGASRPPASLTFIVNDAQDERSVRPLPALEEGLSGLNRSRLALLLPVTASLAPRVRVRCVASIGAVYWQSAEKSAAVVAPGHHRQQPPHEGVAAGSGDWTGLANGSDDDSDDAELEEQSEERQHLLHGRGHHQHSVVAAATAAPADVRHAGELPGVQTGESTGAVGGQRCAGSWWPLLVTSVQLPLLLAAALT